MRLSVSYQVYKRSFILLFLLITGSITILAQVPTGTVRGIVADPSGAVLAGAAVTAKNKATGTVRTVESSPDGEFRISNLLPGDYELSVTMQGFKRYISNVTVQVGDTSTANINLELGQTSETVVVTGDATSVN